MNGNGGKAFNYMAQDDNNNRVAPPPPPPLPPQGTLKSVRSERIESVSSSTDHTIEKKAKENGAGAYGLYLLTYTYDSWHNCSLVNVNLTHYNDS